jgi:N-acyl-L-homoserine lactone synthetase
MLDEPVPAMPGAFQGTSAAASVPGLLHLEDARSLLRYKSYFRAEAVASADLLRMAYSLRYQVYCLERQFETPQLHPGRLETDAYDAQSVHGLLFYRPNDNAIGTSRLILPGRNARPLPVQAFLARSDTNLSGRFPWERSGEVSRFAISRLFRPDRTARSELPCLGLVQLILRLSRAHGITHWVALMTPALLRMLAMMGIEFAPVGPLVSCHGLRQPCGCEIAQMLETLSRKNPARWQLVTDGGSLAER